MTVLVGAGCQAAPSKEPSATLPAAASTGSQTPLPTTATIPVPKATSPPNTATNVPIVDTSMPTADITPTPSPQGQSINRLRFVLIAQFGSTETNPPLFYCDPDIYPVARASEGDAAQNWLNLANKPGGAAFDEYREILAHLDLTGTTFTAAQKLSIYRVHKLLNAVMMQPANDGYQFSLRLALPNTTSAKNGEQVEGTITSGGVITVASRHNVIFTCPICLALGTRIYTPNGPVPVETLHTGDIVWTMSRSGERVASPVMRVSRTLVPPTHHVVHLRLSDGRELHASPGHPLPDGRRIGDLAAGNWLDGATIISAELEPYDQLATYDLLPSGPTGFYWADGIQVASTLK